MAKRIVDEEMRFYLIVDGNDAQKELYKLEKSTREYTQRNKELKEEMDKLDKAGLKNSVAFKNLSAQYDKNNTAIDSNKTRMAALRQEAGLVSLSMRDLRAEQRRLYAQLNHMVPGSAEYKKLEAQLQLVNVRMKELRNGAQATEGSLSRLAGSFNKYQALAFGFIASLTGVVLSLQKIIDYNGKLSDSQADVMKTTGLTKKEVDALTKSFGAFNTRTSRIELLELAEEAGRLGIEGSANIKAFTEQANKMKVALGDDLSTEQIREVGKMVNIYKVGEATSKDFAGAMDALGSAINEVSASGANQAGYLVEYLKRQAGIAAQTKLSAADNVGYAATFDEVGQSVEVSATAMNKVFIDMFKNTAEYAKIAGMGLEDFEKLLAEDANEAMIKFLEGLNGNNAGLGVMVQKMDELDAGGTRGVQALAALASNTDLLRKRQLQANSATSEATSLTDEYNIKNNNLAATIEKIQKKLIGSFSSEGFIQFLSDSVEWFAKFIGASEDADGKVTRFRDGIVAFLKTVLVLTVAIISYNAALKLTALFTTKAWQATKLYNLVQKANLITTTVLRGAKLLLSAAYFALTGNITRATAAMRLFSTVTKLSPIGLLIGLLTAAATAFIVLKNRSEDSANGIKKINSQLHISGEITANVSKSLRMEVRRLEAAIDPLIKILESENTSLAMRKKAYEELIKIAPEFRGTVDKEYKATAALRDVYAQLIANMRNRLQAQAQEKVLSKYFDEEATALDKVYEARKRLDAARKQSAKSPQAQYENRNNLADATRQYNEAVEEYNIAMGNTRQVEKFRSDEIERLMELQKQYAENSKEWLAIQEKINALLGTSITPTIEETLTPDDPEVPTAAQKKAAEERKKMLIELNKDFADLEKQAQDKRLELMDVFFLQEIFKEKENYNRQKQALEASLVSEADIKKARHAKDFELLDAYEAKNQGIKDNLVLLEETHQKRLGTIIAKGIEAHLKDLEVQYEREKIQRQTKFEEELAAYAGNEEALAELKRLHQEEELRAQAKHLEELTAKAKEILASEEFEGFDLKLISESEKQAIVDRLLDIGLTIAQIDALLAAMQGGGEGLDLGMAGELDFLGFTADQWQETFTNIKTLEDGIKAASMAVQGFMEAWAMYDQYVSAAENKRMKEFEKSNNKQKTTLKHRLDSGLINQRQYDKAVGALEEEMDKRKADLEFKQAKRAWQMQMLQAVANTALGVTTALTTMPPASFVLAAITGALGLAQIAIVAKNKPVKGYEEGYYPEGLFPVEREQDGKVFNARYGGKPKSGMVNDPTILVGEMPELIISNPDLKKFNPEVTASVMNEIRRVRGYEDGYVSPAVAATPAPEQPTDNTALMELVKENTEVLRSLKENGLSAYLVRDMENAKKIQDDLERLKKYKQKAEI